MKLGIHAVFAVTVAGVCSASWPVSMASSAAPMTPKQSALKGMTVVRAAQDPMVDKLIVRLRSNRTQSEAQAMSASRVSAFSAKSGVGMKSLRALAGGSHLLQLERAMPLSEAREVATRLSGDADVQFAEPNIRFKRLLTPNEPRFPQWQWNLFAPSSNFTGTVGGSTLTTMAVGGANLPLAWDVTTGSNAVIVAVIDSGITNHTDLNGAPARATYVPGGRFLPGYDFVSSINGFGLPTNFVANDGDGRDPDPSDPGDWITAAEKVTYKDSCDDGVTGTSDSSWHGTHMAGIVAATANNSAGIAGIGWNVRVLPVRALGKCGGDLSDIAEAMRWAAGLAVNGVTANTTPAQVINLSLGGGDTCSSEMQSAVDAVIAAGSVVVAATGNAGDLQLIAPANCKGVVAVTAHTINGENADYANVGTGTTLSAPGGGPPTLLGASGPANNPSFDGYYVHSSVLFGPTTPVSVTALGDTGPAYSGFTGTSVATPQVAGVAALLKSVAPNADPGFIKSWLGAADKLRPHPTGGFCNLLAQECGHGLLDAQKALQAAVDLVPSALISASSRLAAPSTTVALTGTAAAFPAKTIQSAVWSNTAGSRVRRPDQW